MSGFKKCKMSLYQCYCVLCKMVRRAKSISVLLANLMKQTTGLGTTKFLELFSTSKKEKTKKSPSKIIKKEMQTKKQLISECSSWLISSLKMMTKLNIASAATNPSTWENALPLSNHSMLGNTVKLSCLNFKRFWSVAKFVINPPFAQCAQVA